MFWRGGFQTPHTTWYCCTPRGCNCKFTPNTIRRNHNNTIEELVSLITHKKLPNIYRLEIDSLIDLQNVSLHGLVVSSGELRQVSADAFSGLATPLQALGLPNNLLENVPTSALRGLHHLERLDLSHNRLQRIHNISFEVSIFYYLFRS